MYLGIAALAGMVMAVQGTINSVLGKKIGLTETTLIVHLVAVLVLLLIFLISQEHNLKLSLLRDVPWYLYLGGIMGIIITYTVAMSIPKLGVAVATTAIVAIQVSTAALIDHLGLLGLEKVSFSVSRFIGIVLLAAGVKLLLN